MMVRQISGGAKLEKGLQTGAVIESRYSLGEIIGGGGMGVVYRAHDLVDDRPVAFKVINLNEEIPNARAKFLREAEITLQLKHPHIVAVHEIGQVDVGGAEAAPFIVMEFVEGTSLEQLHDLTIAQVIDLGKQICEALEYAHSKGFIHRDLKPENILVEKHGLSYFAKLADFGLARPRDWSGPVSERIEGTIYYLAPEVIAGRPGDVAADLYALGAMMYQMVTGQVPFSDFDAQAILTQHLEETVSPPSESRSGVPPALDKIILRLLAKGPSDRYASARDVEGALEQIGVGTDRPTTAPTLPQPISQFGADEEETLKVKAAIESNSLVTLLADDSRNTLVALASGAKLMEEFSDGVWLVELASLRDPARVPERIAKALKVDENSDRTLIRTLIESLREKNLLLILDQCDHVRAACGQFAETIMRTCPTVRLLATSREPMNIAGETIYRLPA